ncbi:MAG: hypothetical protein A3G76_04170 [Acidobacteria bacterium RIFCSPLOWO2_12_FULL_65_11]|nr:MAG: hypothetical protein A3G76_04170 [Acidobacteria bacterium RIFCSPLOWO2_12_FULL_65_11]
MKPASRLWQCVVFLLEGQRYALHLSQVDRVVSMVAISPLPKTPAIVSGVINHRGSVVPVLDLRPRFGLRPHECGLTDHLLLARTTRRMLALPVDEVLGVNEIPVEDILAPSTLLPGVGYVTGIVALADGLLFIHDLEALLSMDEEQRLTEAIDDREVDA